MKLFSSLIYFCDYNFPIKRNYVQFFGVQTNNIIWITTNSNYNFNTI